MLGQLEFDEGALVVSDERNLCEGHHAVPHAEELEDAQMLLGLRSPALVRGDHEQTRVGGSDPGQHVLDEAGVSRYVDQPDLLA
jgi:hypothetical protein